jgi:hypothetical protein
MATSTPLGPLPPVTARWVETPGGTPSLVWRQYLLSVDHALRSPLLNFANDAAAATGGIQIGQLYQTGGTVKVRVT